MSDEEGSKPSIRDLLLKPPVKQEVKTSIGSLYVRDLLLDDLDSLSAATSQGDFNVLGELAIRLLSSTNSEPSERAGLNDQDFDKLNDQDKQSLAGIVSVACGDMAAPSASVDELGERVAAQVKEINERHAQIHSRFKSAFNFLDGNAFAAVQDTLKSIQKSTDLLNSPAFKTVSGLSLSDSLLSHSASAQLKSPSLNAEIFVERPSIAKQIDWSNTPAVRSAQATEESAAILERVAGHMNTMLGHVGSLTALFVEQVAPQWIERQKIDREAAKQSFEDAATSLWWTKWAVGLSLLVAIFQWGWSYWDGDQSDARTEMQYEQIAKRDAERDKLLHLQIEEAKALRRELAELARTQEEQIKAFNALSAQVLQSAAIRNSSIPETEAAQQQDRQHLPNEVSR